ncbi:MAG: branched-chain amino acid aminotransferase [Aeromicrobium sp.]|uniref:branched-chain amino acid aminotransferase n=1 Tax=Aeromicrobium sp. TaxID=1871063 RepID=UPI003C6BAC6B
MTITPFAARFEANPHAKSDAEREAILADPGFGTHFTDHMFVADWTPDEGWQDPRVVPYGPITLDPSAAVLHYAQEIFEGLKAYAHESSIQLFRAEQNAARMQRSAHRLALPPLPVDWFLGSIDALVRADHTWVPSGGERSLYLRPFMYASESFLGVRPAAKVTYSVIASPAGAYFKGGLKPVSIWLSTTYTRAGAGGTGAAKCGGNYAASLLPQQEGIAHGCDQVVFLDSIEQTWIEELGGMNLFFVQSDGSIVTPALTGSILEGITRDSILTLAADLGHDVTQRRVSLDEWRTGVADGTITEIFACGTAAVVTPVGTLRWDDGEVTCGTGEAGKVTSEIRSALVDIQYGRAEDRHGWLRPIAGPPSA